MFWIQSLFHIKESVEVSFLMENERSNKYGKLFMWVRRRI